jgi:hypothetical protein
MTLLIHLLCLAASFGFAYLWFKTTPNRGSGWAMFAAVLFGLGGASDVGQVANMVTGLIAAASFGFAWYRTRTLEYSGWLLAIAILRALGAL